MIATKFEQDLKLLTREKLTEKYGDHDWDGYYNGTFIGPLEPLTIADVLTEPSFDLDAQKLPEIDKGVSVIPPYKGRAFGKFVMIRRLESGHTGRLVMPKRISGTSDVGWVASVGRRSWVLRFLDWLYGDDCVKKADIVMFDQYAGVGRECRLLDENGLPGSFLLIEKPDILAILEKV